MQQEKYDIIRKDKNSFEWPKPTLKKVYLIESKQVVCSTILISTIHFDLVRLNFGFCSTNRTSQPGAFCDSVYKNDKRNVLL